MKLDHRAATPALRAAIMAVLAFGPRRTIAHYVKPANTKIRLRGRHLASHVKPAASTQRKEGLPPSSAQHGETSSPQSHEAKLSFRPVSASN